VDADDYFAIQKLIFSYPLHLDRGEVDEMAALFAHADVYMGDLPPVRSNPAEIAAAFRNFLQIYPDGTPRTRHMTSNLIIEADGPNQAFANCYVMVFQQTQHLPLQPIIGGDYRDRFEKVNGIWRFTERRIGNDLFGDLSAHGKYLFGTPAERSAE
jgi:SnoaL-like protein